MKPFFSIIIPTYNREVFLRETIDSVLVQTEPAWVLIIIDDNSIDKTKELVDSFDDNRIKYHKNDRNIERSASRNKGIMQAQADYLCFLDSDDLLKPNHLSILKKAIERAQTKVAVFHTGFEWHFANRVEKVSLPEQGELSNVEYVIKAQFPPSSTCVHSEILEKYQFNPELNVNEDVELFARITCEYEFHFIPVYTVKISSFSANTRFAEPKVIDKQFAAMELMFRNPQIRLNTNTSFRKEYEASLHRQKIRFHFDSDTLAQARKNLFKHIWLEPLNPRN